MKNEQCQAINVAGCVDDSETHRRGQRCALDAVKNIDRHPLCFVHASVVELGCDTLEHVLAGVREA